MSVPGVTPAGPPPETAPLWGSFLDRDLERAFAEDHFPAVKRYVRFSVPLSLVAFWSYGFHDLLVLEGATAWRALAIRYGVTGPIGVALILFVVRNNRADLHQIAMLVFGVIVNLVVVWIGAIAAGPGYYLYTSYAVVFVTLGPFLARMNVKTQIVYTALSIALYNVLDAAGAHAPAATRISLNLALLTLGTVGTLAARQLEGQARALFVQRRVIDEQLHALEAERQRSEALLRNVLPNEIAERLKSGAHLIADRFASVTVLFCDIVGFTETSARLAPSDLVRQLDEIFTCFDAVAGELGLEKIKTIGDAYMVCGGVPTARADHAEAVCRMGLAMRARIAELGERIGSPLRVRIGIHTGPVVAGVIGRKKFSYDVWGDTVNTASRMESHGAPDRIQVSAATHDCVQDAFEFEPRGEIEVKGKGTMRTYWLERVR